MLVHLDDFHLRELFVLVAILTVWVDLASIVWIVCLAVLFAAGHSREWPDSDVLVQELLGGEIVHEVLGGNVVSIILVFLLDDLIELLANSLADLLKQEGESFVLVNTDILVELLVSFLDYSLAPALDLIVNEVNFLIELI